MAVCYSSEIMRLNALLKFMRTNTRVAVNENAYNPSKGTYELKSIKGTLSDDKFEKQCKKSGWGVKEVISIGDNKGVIELEVREIQ